MEISGREFERNWQETDNLVRREMDEILREVDEKTRMRTPIYDGHQGRGREGFYLPDGSINPDYAIGG